MINQISEEERSIIAHLRQMWELGLKKLNTASSCTEDDHWRFMCGSFVARQIFHAESLVALVDQKQSADASLISRTMMEGAMHLLYTSHDPQERALDWRMYVIVEDFRYMKRQEEDGNVIDPEEKAYLLKRLPECDRLLRSKEAAKKAYGQPMADDPYRRHWYNESTFEDVAKAVKGENLYPLYQRNSKWGHWSSAGFGDVLCKENELSRFTPYNADLSAECLMVGFQALYHTLIVTDQAFSWGILEQLNNMRDSFIAKFSESEDKL